MVLTLAQAIPEPILPAQTSTRRPSGSRAKAVPAPTVVDLFCGAGGLSEGFQQAGFRVLGGVDLDPDAMATFALNFPAAEALAGDMWDPKVRARVAELAEEADVLVGGPPCQAFSQVRNHTRLIVDPRNGLYREFVEILGRTLPKAFVMENVTGLDQMGARDQMVADLMLAGEYVVRAQVVDAADFGVPQTRRRILFLGIRRDLGLRPPVLQGTDATSSISLVRREPRGKVRYEVAVQEGVLNANTLERLRDPWDDSIVTAEQAISDLEFLRVGNREDSVSLCEVCAPLSAYQLRMREELSGCLSNVQVPRINADTATRLQALPEGGNHRDLPDVLMDRFITGRPWGQSSGTGRLSRRHFYAYRRLHRLIWAWTLNTKADSVYHYAGSRALSVREFARLQSFPDRFVFATDPRPGRLAGRMDGGPAHSRYRQVGNAVPPLLVRAAATALAASLISSARHRKTA